MKLEKATKLTKSLEELFATDARMRHRLRGNLIALENNFIATESELFRDSSIFNFWNHLMMLLIDSDKSKLIKAAIIVTKSGLPTPEPRITRDDSPFWDMIDRLPGGRGFYVRRQSVLRDWSRNLIAREKLLNDHFEYEIRIDAIPDIRFSTSKLDSVLEQVNALGCAYHFTWSRLRFFFEREEDEIMMRILYP